MLATAMLIVTAALTAHAATVKAVAATKVLVVIEENHSLSQMRRGMPYLYAQAKKYGYATGYTAVSHPSLPNYLAIVSGDTFGVADDGSPAVHPTPAPSAFGAARAAGMTARSYQESMPSGCSSRILKPYVVKHNPWAYVPAERAACRVGAVPAGTTTAGALHDDVVAGTLPTVGEVTPNLNHDAHDGTLAAADTWLQAWLGLIYASPDWQAGRLVVVVTADEASGASATNSVLTVVLHPSQQAHVVTTPLTHYSLNRLLTDVAHAPCLRKGCSAASLSEAFGVPLG
ncbi:MAG: alkaline phosphatase family protein [Lapillicoccus sp.]